MDNLAFDSGLTQADRADRARKAWELYRSEHGGELRYLIADLLHLADVDEHPGGAEYAMRRGSANYVAELPAWPTPEEQEITGAYLAQTRPAGMRWIDIGGGDDLRAVAEELLEAMYVAGFRSCDMPRHLDDLVAGDVITSEEGTEFRVTKRSAN